MKSFCIKNVVPIILLFFSLIFIIPYVIHGGIIASGESPIYINPHFYNFYSTWEDKLNFGIESPHQSNIMLFSIMWSVLNVFSKIVHPSIVFIFLAFYLSGLFLYICLDRILKIENKLLYLPACFLYTFNTFRMLGPINERVNLLFIFLPLFFLLYFKLLGTGKWKYVFSLVVVSLLSSSMGSNLPIFTIPYLLMALYFIYYFFFQAKGRRWELIMKNIALGILLVVVNLFWIVPLAVNLLSVYSQTNNAAELWTATSSGNFYDHFRILGSWAWRMGHYISLYYPFSLNYYKPALLGTTYFVTIFSFLYLLRKKKSHLNIFILALSIVSFLLLSGEKGGLGNIFSYFYDNVPVFKIYREPFAKFTILFIFSMSFGMVFSLTYFSKILNKKYFNGLFFVLNLFVLVNAYPLFTTEAMPISKWNGGKNDNMLIIPDYWYSAKEKLEKDLSDRRVASFPFNTYARSYNWLSGASVVGDMTDYLFENRNIKAWETDKTNSGLMMTNIFGKNSNDLNLQKYLGLLNARYVLQENDAEWRYSADKILPPSQSTKWIERQGFDKIGQFGFFQPDYLEKIPNDEPGNKLRNGLKNELLGKPILELYSLDKDFFMPHFYVPKEIKKTDNKMDNLVYDISNSSEISLAIFLSEQNGEKLDNLENRLSGIDSASSQDDYILDNQPVLEFHKEGSTKYRVRIHAAEGSFPLIFSESFNPGWKVYLSKNNNNQIINADLNNWQKRYNQFSGSADSQASIDDLKTYIANGWVSTLGDLKPKEIRHPGFYNETAESSVQKFNIAYVSENIHGTIQNNNLPQAEIFENWFSRPVVGEEDHLMANGFANSWIVNPKKICANPSFCKNNPNGGYDFELVIEFSSQKLFYISLIISCITVFLSLGWLILDWLGILKYLKVKN